MEQDVITRMLEQVAAGEVSIEDARTALSGIELDEDTYENAIDHGVFNRAAPGTIVRASLRPSATINILRQYQANHQPPFPPIVRYFSNCNFSIQHIIPE